MSIYILWPDQRAVPDRTIKMWYEDAVLDGKLEKDEDASILDMAKALDDIGWITLRNPKNGQ